MKIRDLPNCPEWLKIARTQHASVEWADRTHSAVRWRGGVWHGGEWLGGVWHGGEWLGGVWLGGVWLGGDRIAYMAASLGAIPDKNGRMTLYRKTASDGHGLYKNNFLQKTGRVDVLAEAAGSGTCRPGLHATTVTRAWSYLKPIDPTHQLWEIKFKRDDLLDCDGEKVRLKGGWCRKVPWP